MKLQPDRFDAPAISGYGSGWVAINGTRHMGSLVIGSRGQRLDWAGIRFEQLGSEHFEQLAGLGAELVLFGSGDRIRFPHPGWLQPLLVQRVGVETMDTRAACRTYNILAGEGRNVVAALLLEEAA